MGRPKKFSGGQQQIHQPLLPLLPSKIQWIPLAGTTWVTVSGVFFNRVVAAVTGNTELSSCE